jgi:glycosyltransferase 2 family protein
MERGLDGDEPMHDDDRGRSDGAPGRGWIRSSAKWGGFLVVVAFLAWHIARGWRDVRGQAMPRPSWLVGGSALALGGLLMTAWTLHGVLRALGARLPYRKAVGLCFVPMLGRYVPGRVGAVVLALYLYQRQNVQKSICLLCVVTSMALGASGTCLVVIAARLGSIGGDSRELGAVAGLLALLALALHPRVFGPGARWALRRVGRVDAQAIGYSTLLSGIGRSFLATLLYAGGFLFFTRAFVPFRPADAPTLIASFALAQVAGLLAVFAPAGLGVRENVLLLGLSPVVGHGPAIVVTLCCRVWQTCLELIMAALGWLSIRGGDRG